MRRLAVLFLLIVSASAIAADAASAIAADAASVIAADAAFPPLTGRVVDQAGLLSSAAAQNLTAELEAHERATGQQVVVATVASLGARDIADYGVELGRAWGIGQKDKNTGAILLIAPNERAVRIEVGYGLEGTLTDVASRLIIENVILPDFRAGNMESGIVAGVGAMLSVLRGDPDAAPSPSSSKSGDPGETPPIIVALIIVFIMIKIGTRSSRGRRDHWHAATGRRRGGFGLGGFGAFGGRSGGGRSGGGGFSGGGGSFGGGGASGRW